MDWDVIAVLTSMDLPAVVEDDRNRYSNCFRCEPYYPHRVARQFGLVKGDPGPLRCIPSSVSLSMEFYTLPFITTYPGLLSKYPTASLVLFAAVIPDLPLVILIRLLSLASSLGCSKERTER